MVKKSQRDFLTSVPRKIGSIDPIFCASNKNKNYCNIRHNFLIWVLSTVQVDPSSAMYLLGSVLLVVFEFLLINDTFLTTFLGLAFNSNEKFSLKTS